jgi:outer membrane protein with beta-barrel domain
MNMQRINLYFVAASVVSVLSIALPARAETLLSPWVGANTGGANTSAAIDFGASVGATSAGVLGVEFDFGYSPDFFGNGLNSYVLTTMGNVIVGIPFDGTRSSGIRPYATGGIGLIRARIDAPFNRVSIANNDVGVNVGGGVMGFLGAHVGVRADLRYVRSLEDDNLVNSFGAIDIGRVHYWRTTFGLVLR